jgi:hypothetical protein
MTSGSGRLQHTAPMFIDSLQKSNTVRALDRLSPASRNHDESWLQALLYRFPQLLPVEEIEPALGSLVSVCTELPTRSGKVDNLYVTEMGNLAIVECKLWRNPAARRQVVAQIIDYAHSLARWSYQDLENAIRSGKRPDDTAMRGGLFSLVSDETELEEQAFVDAVSRNLRLGRFLLLIVGDGIREGVETLAASLQQHAGFHFTLGIVEMPVFELPPHGFLVQPRILSRTVNIERGIVRFADNQVRIEPAMPAEAAQPTSISKDQLIENLEASDPALAASVRRFEDMAKDLGVVVDAAPKSLQFRWPGPDDVDYTLASIRPDGLLRTMSVNWKPHRIGRVEIAHEYLAKLAGLIGGKVRQTHSPKGWYVEGNENRLPNAMGLLSRSDAWLEIIRWYTKELSSAIEGDEA